MHVGPPFSEILTSLSVLPEAEASGYSSALISSTFSCLFTLPPQTDGKKLENTSKGLKFCGVPLRMLLNPDETLTKSK